MKRLAITDIAEIFSASIIVKLALGMPSTMRLRTNGTKTHVKPRLGRVLEVAQQV